MFHKISQRYAAFAAVAAAGVGFAVAGIGFAFASGPAGPAGAPPSSAAPASAQSITVPPTYESMDKNHDMMVTDAEAKAAMPKLNIKAADKNGDGQLDRVEYLDLQQAVADGTWTNEVPKQEAVAEIKGYDDNPVDVVKNAPKGTLKDPYDPANATVAAEGHQQFLNHGCNACHGGNGGGGMCPPLNNGVWIYGESDDTLFRLVTLGSQKLQEAGYSRVSTETPAFMPPQGGTTVTKAGDLWKIITWIKSMNAKQGS
ncbi:MAG TPA: c-type cytochrome [Rhodanobacteraceae bacterium]|jgi:mono/diheme cytochrome c family protein|nr:c-type cytochrome [Rhodanobacteraceae bacterium]